LKKQRTFCYVPSVRRGAQHNLLNQINNEPYDKISSSVGGLGGGGTYASLKNLGRFTFLLLPSGLRIIDANHLKTNRRPDFS
jgi:hypothetical protein